MEGEIVILSAVADYFIVTVYWRGFEGNMRVDTVEVRPECQLFRNDRAWCMERALQAAHLRAYEIGCRVIVNF